MQPVLSREQVRSFDRRAIEAGVPGVVLMENAGRGAAEVALTLLEASGASPRRVLVLCGGGNNGGDGYVVARRLRTAGIEVEVLSAIPPDGLRGDALLAARAWAAVNSGGLPTAPDLPALREALAGVDLVVDALLGTGANRPVSEPLASWIEAVNAAGPRVLALDVPSGLDADTGAVLGVAVRADATVTFAYPKRGLFGSAGHELAGEIFVADIGVPQEAFRADADGAPAAFLLEDVDVSAALRPRAVSAHKGQSGRVVLVAGSPGKIGAARLAARGALRAGAGLVTVATWPEAAAQLEGGIHEEMTARIDPAQPSAVFDQTSPDVVAVGPGLGLDDAAWRVLEAVLARSEPVVLDADALHLLAVRGGGEGSLGPGPRVLTPHPGEAARLLGVGAADVEADRFGAVRALCTRFGATVVLKGSRTLIATPAEVTRISPWGSPVLATGGTGDVLTGVVAALLVHHAPLEAACLGVAVHGLAGELRAARGGVDRGVLAREVADGVPRALGALLAARRGPSEAPSEAPASFGRRCRSGSGRPGAVARLTRRPRG